MHPDRRKGKGYRGNDHSRGNGGADRVPDLYQYRRYDHDPAGYGAAVTVLFLRVNFFGKYFYWDRLYFECRYAGE